MSAGSFDTANFQNNYMFITTSFYVKQFIQPKFAKTK